jgi:hypothetical protein
MLRGGGKVNFYGGALMGATRGEHPISGSNYADFLKNHPELSPKPDEAAKPGTIPVRTSKSAADISQTMAERGMETLPDDEKQKYSPVTVKEQVQRTADFMRNNPDDARAVVRGEKPLPSGIHERPFFNAMTQLAIETGDAGLLGDLAKSPLAAKTSMAGQTLGLEAHTGLEHNPLEAVREITQMRESQFLKRNKMPVEKAKAKIVDEERKSLGIEITKAASKRPDWNAFIDSIRCN